MNGPDAIDAETWAMLIEAQNGLVKFLRRVTRETEGVEDCVSQAIVNVVAQYDPVEVATEANRLYLKKETIIASMLRKEAERELGKARRFSGKYVSDDTPIGEDGEELHLRDLFVGRENQAERIENYAEWMMFARRGGCPLTVQEVRDLFGVDHRDEA